MAESIIVRIRDGIEKLGGSGGANEGYIRGHLGDITEENEGVRDLDGGELLVHQATSPGLSVEIDDGVGYVFNNQYDGITATQIKFWDVVVQTADPLTISANSSGQTRIDAICLKVDVVTTPDEFASNIATLVVVEGTPGGGIPSIPNYHLRLANVTVVDGETTILDADISDTRTQLTFRNSFIGSAVPSGLIAMWSGTLVSIPSGWALCDGTSGTPDLRDRFIVGAGSTYAVAATGGAATVTLSTAELPSHTHALTDPGHSHSYTRVNYDAEYSMPAGVVSPGTSSTSSTVSSTTGITIDNTGSNSAHENRPPYYALAYIMKL